MNSIVLTGMIESVGVIQQLTDKFTKRDLVLRIESGKYSDYIRCEAINNTCSLVEGYKQDDHVQITVQLTGRKYTKPSGEIAYFTSVRLTAINKVEHISHVENIPF